MRSPYLQMGEQERMRTLPAVHLLPVLLLLLQPLQLQGRNHYFFANENVSTEVLDYFDEISGTGPTRPPTKNKFLQMVLADPDRPLWDRDYCNGEMTFRNVHNRFMCITEHFFLQMLYEELLEICTHPVVPCKNGIQRCRRGNKIIQGVYCTLLEGLRMPECVYQSSYRRGIVLITCRWKNETEQFIPDGINDIVPL
ncbi:inactive ribonuclease-like protein 9 [Nycticebus coucang]|uniref:inactive ribonuclease-like protein 9 n=1 Tax=Nycticebus coucang TaxID=9470 RepID=UPI00234C5157|nr:inactive ribonuclease-like protein 9 [Nycticebus coucang]